MATKVQIAKLALQHVGDRYDISDLGEASTEAEQINLVYDDTRKELLRRHPWRFAMKFRNPAALSVTVPGNWDYAYSYPSDAVRVLQIENPLGRDLDPIDFEVALLSDDTKVILTDEREPEIRYTANIEDPTRFDPEFVTAFSFLLGARVAMALTGDGGIRDLLEQEVTKAIQSSMATDANEGRTKEAPDADWITKRN